MATLQPAIKWSGSKRPLAPIILGYAAGIDYACYYEPFVGGGSVLGTLCPAKAVCGDICPALIALWNGIKNDPSGVAESYRERWETLQREGQSAYYAIRDRFNADPNPYDFLFLSRTCTTGLIRFNRKGEFNNSLQLNRPGIHPDSLKKILQGWSERIQGTEFVCSDYRNTLATATSSDLVYLDPPYAHTKGIYYGGISLPDLLATLESLNSRGVKWMLSFDGFTGDENRTADIPDSLYRRHEIMPAMPSSFRRVMHQNSVQVRESLYLNF